MVDVLVVGAGPAGLAFASAAMAGGMRVGIAEAGERRKVGEVAAARVRVPLEAIGAWSAFIESAIPIEETISLWSTEGLLSRSSVFSPYGAMWGVDREGLEARLLSEAVRKGAMRVRRSRVELIDGGRRWRATCRASGAMLSAPLLVVATGRGTFPWPSVVRRADRLIAIVSYETKGASAAMVVEACSAGWWYTAPLPNGRRVAVLMTDADLLPRGHCALEAFWRESLAQTGAVRDHTALGVTPSNLVVRAAGGSRRRTIAGRNWIAIGDAASAYDPLCGQGIEAALTKGYVAGRILSNEGPSARTWKEFVRADRQAFIDYERALSETYREAAIVRRQFVFWSRR